MGLDVYLKRSPEGMNGFVTNVICSEAELWWNTRPDVKCGAGRTQSPTALHQRMCACVHSRDWVLAIFASMETAND